MMKTQSKDQDEDGLVENKEISCLKKNEKNKLCYFSDWIYFHVNHMQIVIDRFVIDIQVILHQQDELLRLFDAYQNRLS